MSAVTNNALKTLKKNPDIRKINDTFVYFDDYTGEPITERIGFPQWLVWSKKVQPQDALIVYGAFKSPNVAARWLIHHHNQGEIQQSTLKSAGEWLSGYCNNQTVHPALPRNQLKLFGGEFDYSEYHARSPHIECNMIRGWEDVDQRQRVNNEKKVHRPPPFNVHNVIMSNAPPDGVASYRVAVFPHLGYFRIERKKPTEAEMVEIDVYNAAHNMIIGEGSGESMCHMVTPPIPSKMNKNQKRYAKKFLAPAVFEDLKDKSEGKNKKRKTSEVSN